MGEGDKRKAGLRPLDESSGSSRTLVEGRQAEESPERSRRKAEIYKWIRIGGLLSFLPFVMVAGPLAGFYLGGYLEKRFGLEAYVSIALLTIGFAGSLKETIRIVKLALKTQGKD